jgi:hypothetical protein
MNTTMQNQTHHQTTYYQHKSKIITTVKKTTNYINIDQQYADDIGYATTNIGIVKSTEEKILIKLKKRNLFVNTEKTEKYNIKRNGNEEWKKM